MDAIFGGQKNSSGESKKEPDHPSSSPGDLLARAKVVGEAAQSAMKNETDKVDKAKLADAAEDLLDKASKYGKLEGTAAGQYVEKAETYLHQYHASQPATTTTTSEPTSTTKPPSEPEQKGEEKSGGGVGDLMKKAQGFFNKE